ncbi:MAG TPA: HEAT repeat domain-containing protein [Terriglobales bacterium]
MNCEWVRASVPLYVYDELKDDERYEFERHVGGCPGCLQEVELLREFREEMSALPQPEPSPNLLASSRMRLQEALEQEQSAPGWHRFVFDLAGWMHAMRFSPALSAVLLIFGFTAGLLTAYRMHLPGAAGAANVPAAQVDAASIAGIRGIVQDPASNKVQIQYDRLTPESAQGSLDDPRIQQLLLFAAHNNMNTGVRIDSIDLLTQKPEDARIREALIYALRYDKNPGVRLKALEGLRSYVKGDRRVRDAVVEALMKDSNPGVRSQAIGLLESVKADGSVRQALATLASRDDDSYIRTESRRVLAGLPNIE